MKKEELRKIADKFCTTEQEDHKRKPWNQNGKTYATTGFVAIEIDAECGEEMIPAKRYPDMHLAFDIKAKTEIPFPDKLPEPKRNPCDYCNGSGKSCVCHVCDGDGEHECDCGHIHTCRECDGNGRVPCDAVEFEESAEGISCQECNGTGIEPDDQLVDIGPVNVKARFLALLKSLPGAKVLKMSFPREPIVVEFDHGRAAVMGVIK